MFVGSRVLSSSPSWCGIRSWLPLKPVLALRIKRPPTCIPSPAMQHKNGRNITHVSAGHTEAAKDAPNIPNGEDFAWFACGCWLVAGAFLPSLLTCCFYKQVMMQLPSTFTIWELSEMQTDAQKTLERMSCHAKGEHLLNAPGCDGADSRC